MSRMVKLARSLGRARARREEGLFLVEGMRAVRTVLQMNVSVKTVLCTENFFDNSSSNEKRALLEMIQEKGFLVQALGPKERDLFETETPQGILAIVERPSFELSGAGLAGAEWVLLLDGIADPGNMGTILRTAAAAGVDAVLLGENCVDPTNPKVVRSAVGELLRLNILEASNEEILRYLRENEYRLIAAAQGGQMYHEFDFHGRIALVMGSEGHGLSSFWNDEVDQEIGIPMEPGVESLNVAVAAGILLFEARNKRLKKL